MYRHAIDQEHVPPLVAIAALILDLLCIHPFRDGNGRTAKLVTLLLLCQHGYEIGRFISLDRLIEETGQRYYNVLQRSSSNWHGGSHDLLPWLNYFLSIVCRAYAEFVTRLQLRA